MIIFRSFLFLPFACAATLALFYFMQALISTSDQIVSNLNVVRIVDATMPKIVLEVIEEIQKPEPIEQPLEEVPVTPVKQLSLGDGPNLTISGQAFDINDSIPIDNIRISATDGDYLPLVRVPPQYPNRALSRGIEGWSLLEFTVSAIGNVVEESIVVIDGEPPNIFDRSSIRAVARFKYQPRVIEGKGVAVPNVQTIIRYNIDGN